MALYSPTSADLEARTWRHATIEVDAFPFSGAINTVLTVADIDEYVERATRFTAAEGRQFILGGDRAAEVRFNRSEDVLTVAVTASGDDPFPRLTFLIFDDVRLTVTPLESTA